MKKLLGIVVLGLLWCNTGFAECIKGDCINGYGTYTYANESKYVGEYKMAKYTDKELTRGQMETNTLGNLKTLNETDQELIHLQMEQLIKVSGKIIN